MKYNVLNEEKVFTKKKSNDIIKKDYNPLKVNKIYLLGCKNAKECYEKK